MSYCKTALIIAILFNISAYSQSYDLIKITEVNLSEFNNIYEETDDKEALPFSFLPQDVAIGPDNTIYIVNRRTMEITRIDNDQTIKKLSIDDDSLISSAISSKIVSNENKSPFNLKIAVDKNKNLFIAILEGQILEKIIKYDKDFNKDETFYLQQPYPNLYVIELLTDEKNELLIRVFPYAPVGYDEEIKKGLVFLYNNDGTYIGRAHESNTAFERIKQTRIKVLNTEQPGNIILITDDIRFVKSNAVGDLFIYGIKCINNSKPERNKKYNVKDLSFEIKKLKK